MRISMKGDTAIAFAGPTERWKQPDGELLETCTTVAAEPNELLRVVHDHMSVILPADPYGRWLDPASDPLDLIAAYPADEVRYYPISKRVNAVKNDGAG